MKERVIKRYSMAFKRHVVSEYESGASIGVLQRRYGITGNHTIQDWINQYGQEGLRHKLMRIQHPDEHDRMKELEARVQELESALAQVTLDKLMYEAMVDVAEQKYGLELKNARSEVIERAQVLKQTLSSAPPMAAVCGWFGISRQAHHQMQQRRAKQAQEASVVCAEVRKIRHFHPHLGGRKLHKELASRLHLAGIEVGRDRFFEILRRHDLLVEPVGSGRRTTWPGAWRCRNLLADAAITGPNQAWASDITYLATEEGFCYLALITDVYSRYIVGFDLSFSLSVEGAERALLQAVKRQGKLPRGLIHHSDRGIQYTCHSYRRKLKKYGLRSSMGRTGNCYDNALAERVNGILKLEYGLGGCFVSVAQAATAVRQAIWLYNHERPHQALDYQKPYELHRQHLRRQRPTAKSAIFSGQGAQRVSVGRAA